MGMRATQKIKTYSSHVRYFMIHRKRLQRHAIRLADGDVHFAEDLLHQAYMIFTRNTPNNSKTVDERHAFHRLCLILLGLKRDHTNKKKEFPLYDGSYDAYACSSFLSPLDKVTMDEDISMISRNFERLESSEKELFLYRWYDEKKWEELSRLYGIPITTVRSRYVKIIEKLGQGLQTI